MPTRLTPPPDGVLDTAETRAIVELFLRTEGGIGMSEAQKRLQELLGAGSYNAEAWKKLLEGVRARPQAGPLVTVDEAFELWSVSWG
jgi:hypothetical protein